MSEAVVISDVRVWLTEAPATEMGSPGAGVDWWGGGSHCWEDVVYTWAAPPRGPVLALV